MVASVNYSKILNFLLANDIGIPKDTPQNTLVSLFSFLECVDRALRNNLDSSNVSIDVIIVHLIQRAMVPDMISPELDDTPWDIMNQDLQSDNSIVNDVLILLGIAFIFGTTDDGIIDRGFTVAMHLQKVAAWRQLL